MLDLRDPWVCLDCGARQAERGPCGRCGKDDTADLRDEKIRELMRDIEQRLADRRDGRLRFLGVAVGMATVFGLWMVPGYWTVRMAIALPIFFDQWILMAGIGLGVAAVLRRYARPRYPYLAPDLSLRA